jgi:hypothetical protein
MDVSSVSKSANCLHSGSGVRPVAPKDTGTHITDF